MNRNSTVMGTEGINYLLFEIYEEYDEYYKRTDRKIKLLSGSEEPQVINKSIKEIKYNGKTILTSNAIQIGLSKLNNGIYAVVISAGTEEQNGGKEPDGGHPRKFFMNVSEIYVASSYQGYPVVAIGYGGLEGTYYVEGSLHGAP